MWHSQTLFFEQILQIYKGGTDAAIAFKMYLLLIRIFDCDILNNFSIETHSIMGQMKVLSK